MSADLYRRLDDARARRYPKSSTREFALWLMTTALTEYELQEQREQARATQRRIITMEDVEHARLVDHPPSNLILVRE